MSVSLPFFEPLTIPNGLTPSRYVPRPLFAATANLSFLQAAEQCHQRPCNRPRDAGRCFPKACINPSAHPLRTDENRKVPYASGTNPMR
jgi:hypothetical protein